MTVLWRTIIMDYIGVYAMNGRDKKNLNSMCVVVIYPAPCWFEMEQIPTTKIVLENDMVASDMFDKYAEMLSKI